MATALSGEPDLADVLAISRDLLLSREAAARRYVQLHARSIAIVFGQHGRLRYVERAAAFPFIPLQRDDALPALPPRGEGAVSEKIACDSGLWLARPDAAGLLMQTLHQQEGYSMTLLAFAPGAAGVALPPRRPRRPPPFVLVRSV